MPGFEVIVSGLLAAAPDAIIAVGRSGGIVFANGIEQTRDQEFAGGMRA